MSASEVPLWRCTACGRFSQARSMPATHRRAGEPCGPFEPAQARRRGKPLKPRETYRQSLLAGLETCPHRTMHALQLDSELSPGYVGASADLGKAVHAVNTEILRTLYRNSETTMGTQEAVEIMYEVLAGLPLVLPADEREALLGMTLGFVMKPWNTRRIMLLEGAPPPFDADGESLFMDIVCQDGVVRRLTGRPDVIASDPPDGIVIVDYKSGKAPPKQPRKPVDPGVPLEGKQYLSDRGHFQLDTYGVLGLNRFPQAQRATLREVHLRSGQIREATLTRDDLEHVVRELGVQMMIVDRGIIEGPESEIWRPRPGAHCVRQCPVERLCPIPPEQRGVGALRTDEDADAEAARFAKLDAGRKGSVERLKTYHVETGYAPRVGDGKVMRWKGVIGDRSFGMHDPETEDEAEAKRADLEERERATVAKMEAELERRQDRAA